MNKQFTWEVKALENKPRCIQMIGTTEDYDRVGDKMIMAGANLQSYMKNPIILRNHDYHQPAIAKAINIVVEGDKMIFDIEFADTEDGNEWLYLYKNHYMNASSIGFSSDEYSPNEQGGLTFTKWTLIELSLVTCPCNPNAIQRSYEENKISKGLYDSLVGKEIPMEKEKEPEKESEKSTEPEQIVEKAGASISKANLDLLNGIANALQDAHSKMQDFINQCKNVDKPEEGKEAPKEEEKELPLEEEKEAEKELPVEEEKEYSNMDLIKELMNFMKNKEDK